MNQTRSERKQLPWWFRRGAVHAAATLRDTEEASLQARGLAPAEAGQASDFRLVQSGRMIKLRCRVTPKFPRLGAGTLVAAPHWTLAEAAAHVPESIPFTRTRLVTTNTLPAEMISQWGNRRTGSPGQLF